MPPDRCYHANGDYCVSLTCFKQHYREPWVNTPHGPTEATLVPGGLKVSPRRMTSGELNALVVKRNIVGLTEGDERMWETEQDYWWLDLLQCARENAKYVWHDGEEVLV